MSKEHYVNPKVFDRLVTQGKLKVIGMNILNSDIKLAENIINNIRAINKLDKGFKYTCVCSLTITEWLFGYTDETVLRQAEETLNTGFLIFYKVKYGEDTNIETLGNGKIIDGAACSCPFDL